MSDRNCARLIWFPIAAYLVCISAWAWTAHNRLADEIWRNTRTIHLQTDMANAFRWGDTVLQTARQLAKIPPDHPRPLTLFEIYRGEDAVYQSLTFNSAEGSDYQLDYSPTRLLVDTLWTRHIQEHSPNLHKWPGRWEPIYSTTGDPSALATEDIVSPLLFMNTCATAAAAIIAFFLVWLWVWRGARPRPGGKTKSLVPWKPLELRNTHGLLLFPIATVAFFYTLTFAEAPAPPPPPAIAFAGRPQIITHSDGTISALISADLDDQGASAQWHVEFGPTDRYGNKTPANDGDGAVQLLINQLPAHSIIHYRLVATNSNGVTRTDDAVINTADILQPMPPRDNFGAVWLCAAQWTAIAILFGTMLFSVTLLPPIHRGWAAGLVAALLLWFDPSIFIDAYIYPQWDAVLLPWFLLATLLASLDLWFSAGIVLGIGVMFKGQLFIGGPILLLWPILSGKWKGAIRLLIAFALTFALIISPWLVLNNRPPDWTSGPLRWLVSILAAALISATISLYRAPLLRRARELFSKSPAPIPIADAVIFGVSLLLGIVLMTTLVLRRWPTDLDEPPRSFGLLLLAAIALPPWILRRRVLWVWFAAIVAASLWTSAFLFHGDWSWKTIGYDYGTRKHMVMGSGAGSIGNLPRILEIRFAWTIDDPAVTFPLPAIAHSLGFTAPELTLNVRELMICIFAATFLLCGIAAAIQSRRNDPRFLAAIASVWVLMPNILCQMAGRYQMWGAAMTCLLIAVSPGLTLLHVVLSLLAAGMIGGQLLDIDSSRSPGLVDLLSRFAPDNGWIALTIAAAILYIALTPGRRPPRELLLEN